MRLSLPRQTSAPKATSTSVVSLGGRKFCGGLRRLQVRGGLLAAALIFFQIEGNLLAFIEAAHSSAFNSADVNEHVRAAIVWLNESEAFLAIEPLDCTCLHDNSLLNANAKCLGA